MSENKVKLPVSVDLVLPNEAEYISLARYTASLMANQVQMNIEEVQDLRIAITEACTNAIKHGGTNSDYYNVNFSIDDENLTVTVIDQGCGFDVESVVEPKLGEQIGGFGIYLIRTLMDNLEIDSHKDKGTTLKLQKKLRSVDGIEKSTI